MVDGNKIKEERENKNLSQEQLAQKVNCSTSTICRIEKGTSVPDVNLAWRIANFFQVAFEYFFPNKKK